MSSVQLIVVAVLINLVAVFATQAQDLKTPSKRLFTFLDIPKAAAVSERSSIAAVRETPINIDRQALFAASIKTLDLPLFDGRTYKAKQLTVEGFEIRSIDDVTWRGKIDEATFTGDVVLTFKKGYVAGLIYSPNAVYEIIAKGEQQILVELDQSLFPACAGAIKGEMAVKTDLLGTASDSGDRIDVLVLYTAAVKASAGGDTQAQLIAQQAIDATNTSYINSRIRQRVRLVGAQATAMVETGSFSTELSNLRTNVAAATLRNDLKADLVAMLTNSTASCGIGYLMGAEGGNPNNGFSVTARTCAVGNLSFAHELGHNMASHHNPENGGTATYPYGYGHYVNGSYRTVMSYVDPCPSGCMRVPYFSNPSVIYNGQPTGLDNLRDNARSINNTADWIANYRYSGASITLGNFNGNQLIPRSINQSLTWTSNNITGNVRIEISRDGGYSWTTLFDQTPNDNQQTFSFGPRVSKRVRLRVSSLNNPNISDSSVANLSIR